MIDEAALSANGFLYKQGESFGSFIYQVEPVKDNKVFFCEGVES